MELSSDVDALTHSVVSCVRRRGSIASDSLVEVAVEEEPVDGMVEWGENYEKLCLE